MVQGMPSVYAASSFVERFTSKSKEMSITSDSTCGFKFISNFTRES